MLKMFVFIPIMFFCLTNSALGQVEISAQATAIFAVS